MKHSIIEDNICEEKETEEKVSSEKTHQKESSHRPHHHRRRHSSHRKKRRNRRIMWALLIACTILLVVAVVIFDRNITYTHKDESSVGEEEGSDALVVEVKNNGGVLVDNAVEKYLSIDMQNPNNSNIRPSDFSDGKGRIDTQTPVALKLFTNDGSGLFYKVELAVDKTLKNAKVFYIDATVATFEFEHLYANTEYFYRVTVYTEDGSCSSVGSFKTADTPRLLTIDGLSNVRDVGNWQTEDGKRIKQGLLIRGTEMDGAFEDRNHLTNDGLNDMLYELGIKMDMDLRTEVADCMDSLGPRVEHRYYDMVGYENIFGDAAKEKVKVIFADLAKEENYPIYMHCTHGTDRTGIVCYLLEAVLGVSEGDCLKDYGLSNYYIANIQTVRTGLRDYEGDTLKAQAESYLLSCGVTKSEIESIRRIFLGD